MQESVKLDSYEGYSLCHDIECATTRAKQRGTILANIIEDNISDGALTYYGKAIATQWMSFIPAVERKLPMQFAKEVLLERGYSFPN